MSAESIADVAPAGDSEDPCPDGGTRSKQLVAPGVVQFGFDGCRYSSPSLGRFEFNGELTVSVATSQVQLGVLITDLDAQAPSLVSVDGVLDFVPRDGGGFVADGQDIVLTVPESQLTLDLNQLTVDEDGHVLAGGGSIEDTANDFTLQRLDFQVTGPGTATLTATFDDQTTTDYVLNLVTGELTA